MRPRLDGVNFQSLSQVDRDMLTSPFSLEEVEVWGMVMEFYKHAKFPYGFTSYFVALIPKIYSP